MLDNLNSLGLLFWEGGGLPLKEALHGQSNPQTLSQTPGSALQPVNILIGPEGGFTTEEVELAKANGCIVTSLGERILRAETAAISAVTLVQFLAGELG
jgi:16S rRNA (uracil1498-N3)-methyltransferase